MPYNAPDLLNYTHLIIVKGFQTPMDPSPSPPASKPSEYSSGEAGLDHDSRLNRSGLGTDTARGRSGASDWKSSLNISRFAEELKDRSTAPDIVPAARYGASGAIATSADRCALLMHAMRGNREGKRVSGFRFELFEKVFWDLERECLGLRYGLADRGRDEKLRNQAESEKSEINGGFYLGSLR